MASIVSTTRPTTVNTGSNVQSSSTGGIYEDAVRESNNIDTATSYKQNFATPTINAFSTPSIRQQAIKPDTANSTKPEVVYENRYLNNATNAPVINNTSNLTNSDRNDLSIFNRWSNKLRAVNDSNKVTTYVNDPASVPLLRRDTNGFFNIDYNNDGTYHVSTVGMRIPFTDTVVGRFDLGNMTWNPMKAYAVASPIGTYLSNYQYYDTKNKIVQGTLALSNSYSNYYDGTNNFVDNYAIKEWGNLVDMSINWKDRNAMQNAIAGLNTVTGLAHKYGYDNYLGGSNVVQGINDVLAMYTFGNSVYNLGKYWDQMSTAQKVGATLSTINSGVQAYQGLNSMSSLYTELTKEVTTGATTGISSGAASGSVTGAGINSGTNTGAAAGAGINSGAGAGNAGNIGNAGNAGASNAAWGSMALKGLQVVGAAYATYNLYETLHATSGADRKDLYLYGAAAAGLGSGRNTAEDRKNAVVAGASAGASIGGCFSLAWAGIGACIGATAGLIQTSGKFGRSREEWHRSLYRDSLTDAGIFERFDKAASDHGGKTFYQLADGNYYNVGADGGGSRAKDINGNVKTFYNKNLIAEGDKIRDNEEMNPYDIDYTCNMDYTGSLLLAPLNALGLGGSNTRDSGEYGQMLGYMTNAVTSNVGRDFTKENFTKMVDNIKAGYERVGINNKEDALASIGLSYMMGNLTDDDYNSYKLALGMLYDSNGYNRAQTLMDQLNRGEQAQPEPIKVTSANMGEAPAEPIEGVNLIEKESSPVENTQPSEEIQTTVSETERWNNTSSAPIPETDIVEQSQVTEDMNVEDSSNTEVQA